jgi:hypothetical protein
MHTLKELVDARLRQEVRAYLKIFKIRPGRFAELVNRMPGQLRELQNVQPITRRAIEGLIQDATPQLNTSVQVRHFLLRSMRAPSLWLQPRGELVELGYQHMLALGLDPPAEKLASFEGSYFFNSHMSVKNQQISGFIFLDREPRLNVLMARAVVHYRFGSSAHAATDVGEGGFVRGICLQGYVIAAPNYIYLNLHDAFQTVPYTILMEPLEWSHYETAKARQILEYKHNVNLFWAPPPDTASTQILFPQAFWNYIDSELYNNRHQPSEAPRKAAFQFRTSKFPNWIIEGGVLPGLIKRSFPILSRVDRYVNI